MLKHIILLLSLCALEASVCTAAAPRSSIPEVSVVTTRRKIPAFINRVPDGNNDMEAAVAKAAHGDIYQRDNNKGWRNMAIYWSLGLIVGVTFDYIPFQKTSEGGFPAFAATKSHIFGLACTLGVTPRFLARYDKFGREPHLGTAFTFALMNGLFETILFVFSYDIGAKAVASKLLGLSSKIGVGALGFFTFFIYSALIHIMFWLPGGLPKHTKDDAPSFLKQGLPELMLMSISWVWLYVSTGDLISVCLLHFLFNFIGMYYIGLQPPFTVS